MKPAILAPETSVPAPTAGEKAADPPSFQPGQRPATLAGAVPLPGLEPWNGFGRLL